MRKSFHASSLVRMVRDLAQVLVGPQRSSRGQRREDLYKVIKEPAALFTHHPSHPAVQVRDDLLFSISLLCSMTLHVVASIFFAACLTEAVSDLSFLSYNAGSYDMLRNQVVVGRWMCDRDGCKNSVEYDGTQDALLHLRHRDRKEALGHHHPRFSRHAILLPHHCTNDLRGGHPTPVRQHTLILCSQAGRR